VLKVNEDHQGFSLIVLFKTLLLPIIAIEIARNSIDNWFLMSAEAPLKQIPVVMAVLLFMFLWLSWNSFIKLTCCEDKERLVGKASLAMWAILSLFYLGALGLLNLINLVIWLK